MKNLKISIVIAVSFVLSACSTTYYLPKPPNVYTTTTPYPSADVPPEKQSATSQIVYVTDRLPVRSKAGELEFGDERFAVMQYGIAQVRIGEDKSWNDITSAANSDISRIKMKVTRQSVLPQSEFPRTPLLFTLDKGITTFNAEQAQLFERAREDFRAFIRDELESASKKDVVVYIHGFNTSFEEALFTTNDIYHYSGRAIVPIAYSWPAGDGNIFGYFHDQSSADYTIYHLKELFRNLMSMPEINNIHVVAHSLGTEATTTALRELLIETRAAGENPLDKFNIENLILAAPDIDYGVVTQRLIAEQFAAGFGRITVYTNPRDKALSLSGLLQASLRFGKLLPTEEGERPKEIFQGVTNVSFITVNSKTPGISNHGYFVKNPSALSDIVRLINTPSDAGTPTRPLKSLGGNFWEMGENYLKGAAQPLETSN
jgi:esterase/lipase superfamily enzyme